MAPSSPAALWRVLALLVAAVLQAHSGAPHPAASTCSQGQHAWRRVVSVGDLHGDFRHASAELEALGLLQDGHWAGGDAVLVQTGDVVDRGDDGKRLLELLWRLQDEAVMSGGRVVLLIGNHEMMVMQDDLRYTTEADIAAYGGRDAFREAWSPGGGIGRELRRRHQAIEVVGDVVYSHAGVLPGVLKTYSPGSSGEDAVRALNAAAKQAFSADSEGLIAAVYSERWSVMFRDSGPFWTRDLALSPEGLACPLLDEALGILRVRRMVVGHTPQESGEVHTRCQGRLVLGDTFLSQAYTGSSEASEHNAAAVVFFNSSDGLAAMHPLRHNARTCELLGGDLPVIPPLQALQLRAAAVEPAAEAAAEAEPPESRQPGDPEVFHSARALGKHASGLHRFRHHHAFGDGAEPTDLALAPTSRSMLALSVVIVFVVAMSLRTRCCTRDYDKGTSKDAD